MDKSMCRASGKLASRPGHLFKLVIALTLAVSVTGLIVYGTSPIAGEDSGLDCKSYLNSKADGKSDCASVATSTDIQRTNNSSAIDANVLISPNSLQKSLTNNPRAWAGHEHLSNFHGPRSGYTMVELCLAGLDNKRSRCQIGSYNELITVPDSESASGSDLRYTISGHVVTSDGVGLDRITIVASPERLKDSQIRDSETLRFWTVTDSLGAYSLDGLPDGEYTIRSATQRPYRSARISARTGVNYADLVVYQNLATVAEGQVLTAAGKPLEGVTVLPNLLGQPSVLTDDDGRFRLPVMLKPTVRSFTLRFQRPGYQEQSGKVQVANSDRTNVTNVDVIMYPVEFWTELNGTVYSDSGEKLAGRTVQIKPRLARQTYSTITDRIGKYSFPVIEAPANYRLTVFGGDDHKDSQQPIHLTIDTTEFDVVIDSYEFGEVTGRLINVNGVPVPNFDLVLRNTKSLRPNILVSTDKFGYFEIPSAPAGEIVVASQSTPSFLVKGLHLSPDDKLHLALVLDWGEHEIRGTVVDGQDNPVPASRIVLKWSHQADGITTMATRRTAADPQGNFAFSNLGPGPHSLQIDAPGFSSVNIDHDLIRQGYDLTVRLN